VPDDNLVVLNMAATLRISIQIWRRFDYIFHFHLQGGVGGRGGFT